MSTQIFISYRRTGGDITAKLVCEALKNRGYSVFYDYDALKGGFFDKRIYTAIEECSDFVLILPQNALDRCVNDDDWVRIEISHALKNNKNIIPVLLDGFEFPKKLPEDIEKISLYNGVRFMIDYFDAFIDKVVERLTSVNEADTKQEKSTDAIENVVGKLTVKRPSQFLMGVRKFRISIDGARVADIGSGMEIEIPIKGGVHEIGFSVDTHHTSLTVSITKSRPNATVEVRCNNTLSWTDGICAKVIDQDA